MSCGSWRDWLVEALYGELDDERRAQFDSHLRECTSCASLYEEMRATASLMQHHRRPDPGEGYWETYYDRLEARMRARPVLDGSRVAARWRPNVAWGYRVAAAVAVLAAGVWLGRTVLGPDAPRVAEEVATTTGTAPEGGGSAATADSAREGIDVAAAPGTGGTAGATAADTVRDAMDAPPGAAGGTHVPGDAGAIVLASADARALNYVERSQILLLAMINAEPDAESGGAMLGQQRARAGEMVHEAPALREALSGDEDRRLRELVGQLEMILREIANLEAESDLDAVEIIRNRVSREGVLLQINVEQMRSAPPGEHEPRRNDPID